MRKKVTVVGAGNVGASLVQRIAETGLADVVMVDVMEGVPQGKGLDLLEAGPILGYDAMVTGTNGYDETADSNIIVITAGLARKPGMSRDDLLAANGDIVKNTLVPPLLDAFRRRFYNGIAASGPDHFSQKFLEKKSSRHCHMVFVQFFLVAYPEICRSR